eukprot:gene12955-biopygen457
MLPALPAPVPPAHARLWPEGEMRVGSGQGDVFFPGIFADAPDSAPAPAQRGSPPDISMHNGGDTGKCSPCLPGFRDFGDQNSKHSDAFGAIYSISPAHAALKMHVPVA